MKLFNRDRTLDIPEDIILLLNNENMRVFCWIEGVFQNIGTFIESENGLDEFTQCLNQFQNIPITLVVDYAGESFRHEVLPHVGRKDRSAMLKRKSQHFFSASEFRNAKVFDCIKGSRKEDKVLFMALTNTDIFLPWLERVIENKLPLKSISSVAFMMEPLCEFEGLNHKKNLLIVNVDLDGSFRQTLINNGAVLFSRTNPLMTDSIESIVASIENQCVQTKAYLERIKLLSPMNKLEIYVYTPFKESQGFNLSHFNNESIVYIQQHISTLTENCDVKLSMEKISATEIALAKIFTKTKGLNNIYCNAMFCRYYTVKQFVKWLGLGCYGALALTIALLIPLYISNHIRIGEEEEYIRKISTLQDEYRLVEGQAIGTVIAPVRMQLIVDNYEKIQSQLSSPITAMQLVSKALSNNPGVGLSSFSWELSGSGQQENVMIALLEENSQISSILGGTVAFDGSFEKSQDEVNLLITNLESISGIRVEPIVLPMAITSDSQVAVTINDESSRAEFSLKLVYEPAL